MELVTVIVPVYNAEKYLERCVDSILRQTYTNLEIILVDDGSPDRSGELCDAYAQKDGRVRVIHKQNGGVSAARNAGLDICAGAWIMFVDSDDFIAPDIVEYLLRLCREHGVGVAQCGRFQGKDDGFPKETTKEQVKVWEFRELYASPRRIYRGYVTMKLFTASLFRELRFPVGLTAEDWDVSIKALYIAKRIAVSNRRLYYYFMSENSISRNLNQLAIYDAVTIYEGLFRWLAERDEDDLINVTEKELCILLMFWYFRAAEFQKKDDAQKLRKLFLVHYGAIRRKDSLPPMEMAALRLFRFCPGAFVLAVKVRNRARKLRRR